MISARILATTCFPLIEKVPPAEASDKSRRKVRTSPALNLTPLALDGPSQPLALYGPSRSKNLWLKRFNPFHGQRT